MHEVYLLIGSNIGDRNEYLNNACASIEKRIGRIVNKSHIYESEPWGFCAETNFLNMALMVQTAVSPKELLTEIKKIEGENGRKSYENGYSSRTLDIDIIFYDNLTINEPELIIPHNQMYKRLFVLIPLSDIAGNFTHPILKLTVNQMATACIDTCTIKRHQN